MGFKGENVGKTQDVDVPKKTVEDRNDFIERVLRVPDEDHERFLRNLRHRLDRVGLDVPKIEVRYHHLNVEAQVYQGSRATPSLLNFFKSILKWPVQILGVTDKMKVDILSDASGILKPSRLTLLLGPPGSGRTTLLRALAGRLSKDLQISGKITYNGHDMNEFNPLRTSAYTSQYDLQTAELTVRENLDFYCRVQGVGDRHDKLAELTKREKEANITPEADAEFYMTATAMMGQSANLTTDFVMKLMGLDMCADTRIGDAMHRGISGGQKKRVTSAEMLVGPAKAFFMDEISTGLDSSTTFEITKMLQQIVHVMENTIVMSLLQPPPETYALFDDLILLADGQIVYQGPCSHVMEFMAYMGFVCPDRKAPADFLQEVTSRRDQGQYWADTAVPHSYVSVSEFVEGFQNFHVGETLASELAKPYTKSQSHPRALAHGKYGLSKQELLKACFAREVTLMKRNILLYNAKIIQVAFVSFIVATLFLRTTMHRDTVDHAYVYMGALFYSVIFIMTAGLAELNFTMIRLPVYYKEREMCLYPAWAMSLPMILVRIPWSIIEVAVYVGIVYLSTGLSPESGRFFTLFLALVLVNQVSIAIFRCAVAATKTQTGAEVLSIILYSTSVLLGGYVVSIDTLPKWLKWASWYSVLQYGEEAVSVNEFRSKEWDKSFGNTTLGVAALRARGLRSGLEWVWISIGALVGFFILYNILFTLFLQYKDPLPIVGSSPVKPRSTMDDTIVKAARRRISDNDKLPDERVLSVGKDGSPKLLRPPSTEDGARHSMEATEGRHTAEDDARADSMERGRLILGQATLSPEVSMPGASLSTDSDGGRPSMESDNGPSYTSTEQEVRVSPELSMPRVTRMTDPEGARRSMESENRANSQPMEKGATLSPLQVRLSRGQARLCSGLSMPGVRLTTQFETGVSSSVFSEDRVQSGPKGMVLPFLPLFISFYKINYSVDMPETMKGQGVVKGDKLQLLNNVSGVFRPGVLTALVGVSGAGKTTLMDVLAGRKIRGYVEGDIFISGYPKRQSTFTRIAGYCEQTDIHSPDVTVFESLVFSAWMRLAPEVSKEIRLMFVEEVMKLVELDVLRNFVVGRPGLSGLSTEQRTRLTIAVELVANPSIIFMDEPTSGLDARAAAIVMRAVRNIGDTGRTIVCTIHQPSIDIFEAFDELLLLKKGGNTIYGGPLGRHSQHLIEYFEAIPGVPKIKQGYNPATWMLEVSSVSMESKLGVDLAQIYSESTAYQNNLALVKECSLPTHGSKDLDFQTTYAQSFWVQLQAGLWKMCMSYWRNTVYTGGKFLLVIIVGVFLGSIFWGLGGKRGTQQDVFNLMGATYCIIQFLGTSFTLTVQPVILNERVVYYREQGAGMYSPWTYALAQFLIEWPFIFIQCTVFTTIAYPMIQYDWRYDKFLYFFFIMFFSLLYFCYLGMLCVAATPNGVLATILATSFFSTFNIFSGFLITRKQMPAWWKWLYWGSPHAWSFYGVIGSQLSDVETFIVQADNLNEKITVKDYLSSYFGFEHRFLKYVAIEQVLLVTSLALLFSVCIKYLNFQRR